MQTSLLRLFVLPLAATALGCCVGRPAPNVGQPVGVAEGASAGVVPRVGLQIWNHGTETLVVEVVAAASDGTRWPLAEVLSIPPIGTATAYPSGGDPDAMRMQDWPWPVGAEELELRTPDGSVRRFRPSWPAANWAVVFANRADWTILADGGPRRLE